MKPIGSRFASTATRMHRAVSMRRGAGFDEVGLAELLRAGPHFSHALDVKVHGDIHGRASGSFAEIVALASLAAAFRPARILEFGTYEGFSTWHLAQNSPGAHVVTIDLPSGHSAAGSTDVDIHGVRSRPYLDQTSGVTLIETDSRDWVPQGLSDVDLCFIDAGHSYECVRNDTEKALSVMRRGGLLLWHDARQTRGGYGVNRFLRDLAVTGGVEVQLVRISRYDPCGLAATLV